MKGDVNKHFPSKLNPNDVVAVQPIRNVVTFDLDFCFILAGIIRFVVISSYNIVRH